MYLNEWRHGCEMGRFCPDMLTPLRVVVLDKVTDLLLFFGKLLVVGGVGKDIPISSCGKIVRGGQDVDFQFQ